MGTRHAARFVNVNENEKLIFVNYLRPEGPHRRTQSAGDPAVTVITIGAETSGGPSGILPSVLRGKPRVVTGQGGTTARPASSRPDVSTVFLLSVLRGKPRVVTGQGGTTVRPASSRPDVSTVVLSPLYCWASSGLSRDRAAQQPAPPLHDQM